VRYRRFFNAEVETGVIDKIIASLHHRGPDDQQRYADHRVGMFHTRLSIIELSPLGRQPYRFEDLVLVFNGELYNYREVREQLVHKGYQFISNSDTEVLIKAFHCWGEDCVSHFIGMFAFAVYRESTNEIWLFRDRAGVKPLYYRYENGTLFFASELSALLLFPVERQIDIAGLSLYFRFGFIPHPHTIYTGIHKLEPAHWMKVSAKGVKKHKYWSVNHLVDDARSENDWLDHLEAVLTSAFRYRMVSDVPVGIFLSGGIDSSLMAAILQKHQQIHAFTIGFEEKKFDELAYAQQVAAELGMQHTQKTLTLKDAHAKFNEFYSVYDEPFADTSGIPVGVVTKLAKDHGMKVVLSADGGDEIFGGYDHYRDASQLYRKLNAVPLSMRRAMAGTSRTLFAKSVRQRTNFLNLEHKAYAFEEVATATTPAGFYEAFIANQSTAEIVRMIPTASFPGLPLDTNATETQQIMMDWDFQYHLPGDLLTKVDRATMYQSVECREPFLDHRIVELAARMPLDMKVRGRQGKYVLRKLLARHLPSRYFERKKQGFSIPIFDWFSREMDSMFNEYLSPGFLAHMPFMDAKEIQREHDKYRDNKKYQKPYNMEKMWRIMSFAMWWEKYHG